MHRLFPCLLGFVKFTAMKSEMVTLCRVIHLYKNQTGFLSSTLYDKWDSFKVDIMDSVLHIACASTCLAL